MKLCYYAHPMDIYNTIEEAGDIQSLMLLGFEVINPNTPGFQEGYKTHGMTIFEEAIEECDALAFRATPDGRITAGVYKEIMWARERYIPVIEMPAHNLSDRALTVEQTRAYLKGEL